MNRDDLAEAYERELTDPGFDPDEPDHTWTNACQRPVGKGMTFAAVVAGACAGVALGLLLVGLAS